MVEYRLKEQLVWVQASPKSDLLVILRVFVAVTGNRWFVANNNRVFKLLVQGFSHNGGTSGQVGISASESQPARPNFETKM